MDCTIIYPDSSSKTLLYKNVANNQGQAKKQLPIPEQVDQMPLQGDDLTPSTTTTSHMERIHGETVAWESARCHLLGAFYSTHAPADGDTCFSCHQEITLEHVHFKCHDCGTPTYFCSQDCASKIHSCQQLIFHKLEMWQVYLSFS